MTDFDLEDDPHAREDRQLRAAEALWVAFGPELRTHLTCECCPTTAGFAAVEAFIEAFE